MQNLDRRLAALERYAGPARNVPVSFSVLRDCDDTKPFFVEYAGQTWTQMPDESLDLFKERAAGLAQLFPAPSGEIGLMLRRPELTKEQARAKWLEAHHGPDWKTIVGEA